MPFDDITIKQLQLELLYKGKVHDLYHITSRSETVRDYIDELKAVDNKRNIALWARIKRVADRHFLDWSEDLVKPIEGKIMEIRSPKDRILFFRDDGNSLILTNCFKKMTQRTPRNKISIAEAMRLKYLNRKNGGLK